MHKVEALAILQRDLVMRVLTASHPAQFTLLQQPPAINHQPPAISHQPPAISNQPPATSSSGTTAAAAVAQQQRQQ
jgi:hypothetical protein